MNINQNVIYEHGGASFTGKIAGKLSSDQFYVLLDMPLRDGTTAMLVSSDVVRPLNCHWCRDTQRVSAQFTGAQLEANDIPTKPCPYCEKCPCVFCRTLNGGSAETL